MNIENFFVKIPNISKNNSSPQQLIQYHLEQTNKFKNKNYLIWYCDGAKTPTNNSFAIVNNTNKIIKTGILPHFTSIFTSEITAIEEAIKLKPPKNKLLICTDSLSSINALKSHRHSDILIQRIKGNLVRSKNTKILYTPAHINIPGNEMADKIAKETSKSPTILINNYTKKDINNFIISQLHPISSNKVNAHYKTINPCLHKAIYPRNYSKQQQKIVTRLRLGHSKLTHEHLLTKNSNAPRCPRCNNNLTIPHILTCFNNNNIKNTLKESIQHLDYEMLKQHLPSNIINKI